MTHVTPNTTNAGFRFYDDDVAGAITAQTALAAANVNVTIDTGVKFHAVLRWNENAGADASVAGRLEYNLASAGWNDVTTTTPVQSVAPTNCTTSNGAQYATNAAGLQNGTTVERGIYNTGGADVSANTLNNSSDEAAFCLRIDSGQVTDGQTVQLRISNAGTALSADTTLSTITINVPPVTHATTGAITGPGSTLDGASVHNVPHATSGIVNGPGTTVAGSAERISGTTEHATTGALSAGGAAVAGAASNFTPHSTSGTLTGPGSSVAGSANRFRAFATTGILQAQGSNLSGSAALFRAHGAAGALVGAGPALAGSASRSAGPLTHVASGALIATGAGIGGAAATPLRATPVDHARRTQIVAGDGPSRAGESASINRTRRGPAINRIRTGSR